MELDRAGYKVNKIVVPNHSKAETYFLPGDEGIDLKKIQYTNMPIQKVYNYK